MSRAGKLHWLRGTLEKLTRVGQVIVFAATREDVDVLSSELGLCKIHGGMKQGEREIALKEFKPNTALVATNLMGRGIHIPKVYGVVCWSEPKNWEEYVHKRGRAGRGEEGASFVFEGPVGAKVLREGGTAIA